MALSMDTDNRYIPHTHPQEHTKTFLLNMASTIVVGITRLHEADMFNVVNSDGEVCDIALQIFRGESWLSLASTHYLPTLTNSI